MMTRDGIGSQVDPRRVLAWRRWLLLATALSGYGCGANSDPGSSGSETHWLSSCDSDAECGEYRCLCGRCTTACQEDAQCSEQSTPVAVCAESSSLRGADECEPSVPVRICVDEADAVEPIAHDGGVDPGPAPSGVDGGPPVSPAVQPDPDPEPNPDPAPDPNASPVELCDGSDAIRLVVHDGGGGPLNPEFGFVQGYGWRFLVVDGHCNYWVSTHLGRFGSGSIDDPSVLDSYAAAGYAKLDQLSAFQPVGCPDSGTTLLWDPYGAVRAGNPCGDRDWPDDWSAAFDAANELLEKLAASALLSTGPLRILVSSVDETPGPETSAWPLSLDPTPVLVEVSSITDWGHPQIGALFASGPDAEALRAAQQPDSPVRGWFDYTTVQGQTDTVQVMMRDELPPRVRGALEAAQQTVYYDRTIVGRACGDDDACGGLQCSSTASGDSNDSQCTICLGPEEPAWACQDNDDCCAGLVCCVDCGEQSGRCLPDPDPCESCLNYGGVWLPGSRACASACALDAPCFTETCPDACSIENCGGCFDLGECWAAGCSWLQTQELAECAPMSLPPQAQPCSVDATDPSLPGVTVHLESDTCTFVTGDTGQFRYAVTVDQALAFETVSSGGACGLCGDPADIDTWTAFALSGEGGQYCPECDIGCCAPTAVMPASVGPEMTSHTIDWPGLQWSGPSDTSVEPSGAFPPGDYEANVTFRLPGLGAVIASLPVKVVPGQ